MGRGMVIRDCIGSKKFKKIEVAMHAIYGNKMNKTLVAKDMKEVYATFRNNWSHRGLMDRFYYNKIVKFLLEKYQVEIK